MKAQTIGHRKKRRLRQAARGPVTTAGLDRSHSKEARILTAGDAAADGFAPIIIRGEPLSATVLRERR